MEAGAMGAITRSLARERNNIVSARVGVLIGYTRNFPFYICAVKTRSSRVKRLEGVFLQWISYVLRLDQLGVVQYSTRIPARSQRRRILSLDALVLQVPFQVPHILHCSHRFSFSLYLLFIFLSALKDHLLRATGWRPGIKRSHSTNENQSKWNHCLQNSAWDCLKISGLLLLKFQHY